VIVYLDTSALVKLFVTEACSDEVLAWAAEATIVACSSIGFPEAVSAFSRRLRAGFLARPVYDRVLDELDRRWDDVVTVAVDERLAGDLARSDAVGGGSPDRRVRI
jgi:predicted nucleic acid-binding protein